MSKVSWLHLSDMHIDANRDFDQMLILHALLSDLMETISKYNIELNFIFFTGDVAFSATMDDYKLAESFFNHLCDNFNFDKDNLFIIPGNHDVNRYKVSKILDDERMKLSDREEIRNILKDRKIMKNYLTRFDNYSKFISNLYIEKFIMGPDNFFISENRTANGIDFGIIGLNSAWSSFGGRHDSNNI
ncbi:MAG: metallophosphoesterase family protein [Candidatus Odinarchaeota archaeon]